METADTPKVHSGRVRIGTMLGGLVGWTVVGVVAYIGAQYIVSYALIGLIKLGIITWSDTSTVDSLSYRVLVYAVMVLLFMAVLWYRYRKVGFAQFGLSRLPEWGDIGLSLAGVIIYMLTSTIALTLAAKVPGFSSDQTQDLGLSGHLFGTDLGMAFVVLVILTPLFEEAIFRGFLYGRLRGLPMPWWGSAFVVSLLFGIAHLQWNVGIDVFCLSIVACILREMTGSIWAGVLLHVVKNFLAFLVTFVFIQGV